MITTYEAKPIYPLSPYVYRYTYREFNTNGADVTKPKHAVNEIVMHFFFRGMPVKLTDPLTGAVLKTGKRSGVCGMSSRFLGEMTFNGLYSFFEIAFTPHGFQRLFGIPSQEVLDKIAWSEELFDSSINILHEQLFYCSNIQQMANVADAWLLRRLCKLKYNNDTKAISHILHCINSTKGLVNIDMLAANTNMSVRSFERHFVAHTGIPAKLFCCIARFNHALELKLSNPQLRWTKIAYKAGYFDQMHLVKDFKKFSGDAPSVLLKETPLLVETHIADY
ncbi:MAG: AraC family transcriptional regulator [Chitinophagaceae bacterium]|nr:AraC family transcriptional regulator [Chitinophagaceae bacterium]